LREYASKGVHEKVLDIIRKLPRGTLLDTPAGQGAVSLKLKDEGFKFFCLDINRKDFLLPTKFLLQANLQDNLPYKNESFDIVVCVEGIEHLENPHHLVREFHRIIKDEGYLLLTTPNIFSFRSRFKFFRDGYLSKFKHYHLEKLPESQWHTNPIGYPELEFLLTKYGFSITEVTTNQFVKKMGLLYPIFKAYISFYTRKRNPFAKILLSREVLEGEILILLSKKE